MDISPTKVFPTGLNSANANASHMRNIQNTNFNHWISNSCMKAVIKSHLNIPFCPLLPLPLVRPILEMDVQLVENKSVNESMKATWLSMFLSSMTKGEWIWSHNTLMIDGMSSYKYPMIHLSCI